MHIECPSCSANNEIEFSNNILCHSCNKTFSGHSYKKFKKPLLSATTALIIGMYSGYKADQYFLQDQRYPLKVEYELVDNCINSSSVLMTQYYQVEKSKVCTCALEETMKTISYKELVENESGFLTRFRGNLASCR